MGNDGVEDQRHARLALDGDKVLQLQGRRIVIPA